MVLATACPKARPIRVGARWLAPETETISEKTPSDVVQD